MEYGNIKLSLSNASEPPGRHFRVQQHRSEEVQWTCDSLTSESLLMSSHQEMFSWRLLSVTSQLSPLFCQICTSICRPTGSDSADSTVLTGFQRPLPGVQVRASPAHREVSSPFASATTQTAGLSSKWMVDGDSVGPMESITPWRQEAALQAVTNTHSGSWNGGVASAPVHRPPEKFRQRHACGHNKEKKLHLPSV